MRSIEPNAELSGMAGAEDPEVWERRPFPLERLVRDARISARRSFASLCEKQVDRADPLGRSTRRSRRAQRGANDAVNQRGPQTCANNKPGLSRVWVEPFVRHVLFCVSLSWLLYEVGVPRRIKQ
jgi:hypothetical protein